MIYNNIIPRPHCDTKLNQPQPIDMETEISFPAEFMCPISQDIMNEPVVVTHHDIDYHFDEACIKTWKTTPNGDKNPLTMMSGFLEATVKKDIDMKERIQEFKVSHGLCTDTKTEEVKLEPFGDYQQIQNDEEVARRLHVDMNGPPPGTIPISDIFRPRSPRLRSPTWVNYNVHLWEVQPSRIYRSLEWRWVFDFNSTQNYVKYPSPLTVTLRNHITPRSS